MEFEIQVRQAIYRHFSDTGRRPSLEDVVADCESDAGRVLDVYQKLCAQRLLVLEADGSSIRMAPPFSGVATQHVVDVAGISYFANCAWDALGIPAALRKCGTIHSRCEQSGEPLQLEVNLDGPERSDWLFHCAIPVAHWWDDVVFT